MSKRNSAGMEVLLGLLSIEPMSGYDLGVNIRHSVGYFWNESYGQIYPNLKRLVSEGLATSVTERKENRPDRHVYSITPAGSEHLAAWLAVEPQPEIPRNELLLKLFFGGQAPTEVLIDYVERMAKREGETLARVTEKSESALAERAEHPDAPYWRIAARYGQLELEAHQRWAAETLTELRKMAERQARENSGDDKSE